MSNDNPYAPPKTPFEASSLQALLIKMPLQIKIAVGLQWLNMMQNIVMSLIRHSVADAETNMEVLISMAVGLIIVIVLNVKLYEGKNWARYVLLVFAIISAGLVLFPSGGTPINTVLEKIAKVVNVLFDAGTLYLIFSQPGATWFQRK